MDTAKVLAGIRKAKKKQVKDELDRMKQAEKKKRRLEKALATSAAIRSELEKKKQKKKEEQERLDEEGAKIAEAVALHVLLGEDSDDSSNITSNKDEGLMTTWDHDIIVRRRQSLVPFQDLSSKCSFENIGWVSDSRGYGRMGNYWENSNLMVSSDPFGGDFLYPRYVGEESWGPMGLSAGHLAAQAVSSLKIADDDGYVFNRMLRG
ncbi:hypothetical protein PHJA_002728200 [Phtheirospermum japonicum]|uniref:Uncharacterized protein n=1 Tax=Phtheirospermum japonicum TaxID=374723 RepID=A0A830D104_9LAMI|nr:hypothetical protein PHJA_002728200 [Phtheirospermum japonicum]